MNIIEERLAALTSGGVKLDEGAHASFEIGHCAMEVVAWLAGSDHTDAPDCASTVLRVYTIRLNDRWDDAQRQKLIPFLPRMVGTNEDGQDEARSYLALDWLIRTCTPTWLELAGLTWDAEALRCLERIVDVESARKAGPVVRRAREHVDAIVGTTGDADPGATVDTGADSAWTAVLTAAADAARESAADDARDAVRRIARSSTDTLQPTVTKLQDSALDPLDRMIGPFKKSGK